MDIDVANLECSDLGRLGADPLLSTKADNVVEISAATNDSNEISGWDDLGTDLQLSILSVLRQQADRESLQAVLQTSHTMQLLASSLIHAAVVCDAEVLTSRFPRHATLASMQLVMQPAENKPTDPYIGIAAVIPWLETSYASGCSSRLRCVTDVKLKLPYDEGERWQQDEALVVAIIEALSRACPGLRSLCVHNLDRDNETLMIAFFKALVEHLPGLAELEVGLGSEYLFDLRIAGIDWAASLPPALCKLTLPLIDVDLSLLQHLVRMPKLVEVEAHRLPEKDGDSWIQSPLDSDSCAWQVLKLANLPSFNTVCQFTAWPRVLLNMTNSDFKCFSNWQLDPPCPAQTAAVLTAAERLTTCSYTASALGDLFIIKWEERLQDPASAAGIISALAPLARMIPKLRLINWPISAALLDEVAQALPQTSDIAFQYGCSMTSDAWVRLLTLTSVTHISFFLMGKSIQLADFVSFMTAVPRAISVGFDRRYIPVMDFAPVMSASDLEAWDRFEPSLAQRRRDMGLPPLTITDE